MQPQRALRPASRCFRRAARCSIRVWQSADIMDAGEYTQRRREAQAAERRRLKKERTQGLEPQTCLLLACCATPLLR